MENEIIRFDRQHLWHPYTSMKDPLKVYEVAKAQGVMLTLADGRELIDGMSSWWAAILGYNNQRLNRALIGQSEKMAHVMFGGLTHEPAVRLGKKLLELVPEGLNHIFYCDSGSVSVEVAIKMALQYQHAQGKKLKRKIGTFMGGYHGDTWHAMSVCDPVGGMHTLYNGRLPEQLFLPRPAKQFHEKWDNTTLEEIEAFFEEHRHELAAFILEPIVQGAGGMRFYHKNYLAAVRALCNKYDVLLIADEIATGFGRSGKMFACEWADVVPDIMCVGKALTGGYMSFAATLATTAVAETISSTAPFSFMHGPTFMGNPLACAVAAEVLTILQENPPTKRIGEIEARLKNGLEPARALPGVADVRVLGAIGVIEMKQPVEMERIEELLVQRGVWLRPFGKLIYTMPPYIATDTDLDKITGAMVEVAKIIQS